MMGYTHMAVGAAGTVTLVALSGTCNPETYLIASVAGALGGVAIDIDAHDHFGDDKCTDAGRTRLAAIGFLGLGVILDLILQLGIMSYIVSRQYLALGGLIAFVIFLLIGFFSEHRTFSHSLLFVLLTSICVAIVLPNAMLYYAIGSLLHLILDMLNFPYKGHGVWLLFPVKTGKGIALKVCKSSKTGNKVAFYIGITVFVVMSVFLIWQFGTMVGIIISVVVILYMIIVLFLVKRGTEKELLKS